MYIIHIFLAKEQSVYYYMKSAELYGMHFYIYLDQEIILILREEDLIMKKTQKILAMTLATAIVSTMGSSVISASAESNSPSFTDTSITSSNEILDVEQATIDEILSNPLYSELNFDFSDIELYKEIEDFKEANPNLSDQSIVAEFDNKFGNNSNKFSLKAVNDDGYADKWAALNSFEKGLAASNPAAALIVNTCRNKANTYASESIYKSQKGNGTAKDAYRHAIWNALMSKYVSKQSAELWATAHEEQSDPNYPNRITDGIKNSEHTRMDLHNNKKGRDCWSVLTDTILFTSDQDLKDRVVAKIKAGEMIVLNYN
jgi:aspartyl-tRNA synthetase